jgi:tRNA-2-methylthio-N6-dimethylallyladenosine synthase
LRNARPDIAFSSDFIVGFPGESATDFAATMALVREVEFAMAYSFKYSPRPGTPAASMDLKVSDAEQDARLQELQAVLNAQQQEFNRAALGRVLPILLEKPGRREGQLVGKSPYAQAVHVDASPEQIGRVVETRITDLGRFSLRGEIETPSVPLAPRHMEACA